MAGISTKVGTSAHQKRKWYNMLGTINGSVTCGPHPPWTPWSAPPSVTQRTSLGWFGCLAGNPLFYQLLFFSYRQIDINFSMILYSKKRQFYQNKLRKFLKNHSCFEDALHHSLLKDIVRLKTQAQQTD